MKREKSCVQSRGLSVDFLARSAEMLKLLAHPHRLQIVELLDREGEVGVSQIVAEIKIPQSSVSLHLNQMKRLNLLEAKRTGREVKYRISDPRVFRLLECMCKNYHEECDKRKDFC